MLGLPRSSGCVTHGSRSTTSSSRRRDLPGDDPVADAGDRRGRARRARLGGTTCSRASAPARAHPGRHVVRLTADCPLVDPAVVAAAVDRHAERPAPTTRRTRSCAPTPTASTSRSSAPRARRGGAEADDPAEREHVTPFVYRRPDRFGSSALCRASQLGEERWTVDTADDLERIRSIVGRLAEPVARVLARRPRRRRPQTGATPASLWLAPDCWPGVASSPGLARHDRWRRRRVAPSSRCRTRPWAARLRGPTDTSHEDAEQLVRQALRADRQVVHLEVDRGP